MGDLSQCHAARRFETLNHMGIERWYIGNHMFVLVIWNDVEYRHKGIDK